MRMTQLVGSRYKERPREATLESHAFLLRGGYARQVAGGIYSLLPPAVRVVRKIERILREEMNRIGGQEVLMPVVNPRELWEESGRYQAVGSELLRFKDRTGHDMVLAMTHEEATVHLLRNEIQSHAQLPVMVYHIQTKFRDEPRSRGGLIRVREFTMKDGYSFHASMEDLERYYEDVYRAYHRIFTRCGVPEVVAVASDTGMMGGKIAHEFILLCDAGEDTIVVAEDRSYLANQDVAVGRVASHPGEPLPLEKVHTPGRKTIEEVAGYLGVPTWQTGKAVFYDSDAQGRLVLVVVRGDREVSEAKLSKLIGAMPVPAGDEKIRAAGAVPGYASPMGLDAGKVNVLIDRTIAESNNLVVGANETDWHFKNFNLERDMPGARVVDAIQVADGDLAPGADVALRLLRGIEVGNIFQLGTKYSAALQMTFDSESGKPEAPVMGCYGIGVGRLLSSVMEARHDQYGPLWPMAIAPWQVHIVALRIGQGRTREVADQLYKDLTALGIETLYDDRDIQTGAQFAEADLLGIPLRLVVSERNLKDEQLEWKRRDKGEQGKMPLAGAAEAVAAQVKTALAEYDALADAR
jgi:prolyl-tRNA synthetase